MEGGNLAPIHAINELYVGVVELPSPTHGELAWGREAMVEYH